MKYGILFNEEDSRRIDGLLEYCELESVSDLLSMAIDTMYDVIEMDLNNERV